MAFVTTDEGRTKRLRRAHEWAVFGLIEILALIAREGFEFSDIGIE